MSEKPEKFTGEKPEPTDKKISFEDLKNAGVSDEEIKNAIKGEQEKPLNKEQKEHFRKKSEEIFQEARLLIERGEPKDFETVQSLFKEAFKSAQQGDNNKDNFAWLRYTQGTYSYITRNLDGVVKALVSSPEGEYKKILEKLSKSIRSGENPLFNYIKVVDGLGDFDS